MPSKRDRKRDASPLPACPECGQREAVRHVLLWTYGCTACHVTFDNPDGVTHRPGYPFMRIQDTREWRHIRRADRDPQR